MKRIKVGTSRSYDVIVGRGAVECLGGELRDILKAEKILIVTDDNVAHLYLEKTKKLVSSDFSCYERILPSGEKNKNLESVTAIISDMQRYGFDRNDAVLALGGGVVGDTAAFSASIYMRGIDFVNVPTTLLSQVDSSVGGKTGVDFGGGKNIVGTFYSPKFVVCDTSFTDTLLPKTFSDGCAEIIKYAFIGDGELLEKIGGGIKNNLDDIVYRCVSDKNEVVTEDEFDRGRRAFLNFGHTVGHAVESLSGYAVSHGSAVSIGMRIICEACEKAGICEKGVTEKLSEVLRANGLPLECGFSPEALTEAIRKDKKKSGEFISVIVPTGLCECRIEKMTFDGLFKILKDVTP